MGGVESVDGGVSLSNSASPPLPVPALTRRNLPALAHPRRTTASPACPSLGCLSALPACQGKSAPHRHRRPQAPRPTTLLPVLPIRTLSREKAPGGLASSHPPTPLSPACPNQPTASPRTWVARPQYRNWIAGTTHLFGTEVLMPARGAPGPACTLTGLPIRERIEVHYPSLQVLQEVGRGG